MPWTHRQTVRLRHIDAAGVIFYPRLLEMAHEAYEVLLDALGQPLAAALDSEDPVAPIVRCEADFRKPMTLGAEVEIAISVVREGNGSYTLGFAFRDTDGEELATAKVTHAAIDRKTGQAVPLTDAMRKGLEALREA